MTHDISVTNELAAFVATTPGGAISPDAVYVARLSLLDWLSVGLAGRDEPVSRICRNMVLEEGGAAQSSVLGAQTKVPARAAALSNGTTSHALDYDDTHFAHIGHPSVAVFPAALAIAEKTGASQEAFVHAALIGMELSIRVGLWLGRRHYQAGFHQTATAGTFGATAACARLLGLDRDQTAMALGLAATRASGLKAQFGTMGKPFNAGLAASNGVEAATLVQMGLEANPQALEGALGFGQLYSGEAIPAALDGLGAKWLFEGVSHKFHACCHGLHATLEALAELPAIEHQQVARVEIDTHPRWMTVCHQPAPTTGLGAKFSYTTVTAMHLLGHSTARLDRFSDQICADMAVQEMRAKVHVREDSGLSETEARVRVALEDGQQLDAHFDLNAPLSLPARAAKVKAKSAALLGPDLAETLWSAIENQGPVAQLTAGFAP